MKDDVAAMESGDRDDFKYADDFGSLTFYERFDFEGSLTDPHHLLLPMKDVRALLGP